MSYSLHSSFRVCNEKGGSGYCCDMGQFGIIGLSTLLKIQHSSATGC